MQRIVPNIWCNRTAEEAAAFYTAAFPDASSTVTARYPATDLPEFQQDFAGEAVTIDVEIDGYRLTLINAGDEFAPDQSLSFMVNFDPLAFGGEENDARAALDALWSKLCDGGVVRMDLGAYPFSPHYGWVEDRFGVSWQLILTDPSGEPRPFLMPSFLFGGPAQDRAREAIEEYTALFGRASVGTIVDYPAPHGPAAAGAVMFADFTLEDQWFVAMDAGAGEAAFTPGVSLMVECPDQAEIDRLWDALSAVPEAEQCGWLTDRFGVSWQIVPAGMDDLMKSPGSYQRMLGMKKIVIADL